MAYLCHKVVQSGLLWQAADLVHGPGPEPRGTGNSGWTLLRQHPADECWDAPLIRAYLNCHYAEHKECGRDCGHQNRGLLSCWRSFANSAQINTEPDFLQNNINDAELTEISRRLALTISQQIAALIGWLWLDRPINFQHKRLKARSVV